MQQQKSLCLLRFNELIWADHRYQQLSNLYQLALWNYFICHILKPGFLCKFPSCGTKKKILSYLMMTHCLCGSGFTVLLAVKLIPRWVCRRDEAAKVWSKALSKLWPVCPKRQFLHRSGQEGRKEGRNQSADFFFCQWRAGLPAGCRRSSFDTADAVNTGVSHNVLGGCFMSQSHQAIGVI